MVGPFRPQTDAGSICQPEAASLGLLLWHFEPLPPPDPLHPLLVHPPADLPQQGGDPPIAIATILTSQVDDGSGELLLIVRNLGARRWVERGWPMTLQARRWDTPTA